MQTDAEQGVSLDPKDVKPGDTVTLESVLEAPFKVTGVVEKIDITLFDADGLVVAFNVMIWSRWFTVGINLRLTDHQPAPEPEPEWKRGTVARLSLVDDDLAPRVYRTGIGTWRAIDDSRSWTDADVEYVHEMVVIDPADVDEQHRLAAIIREVDGNHDLGAGALAEAILEHLGLAR
jgi:hypothetical protein